MNFARLVRSLAALAAAAILSACAAQAPYMGSANPRGEDPFVQTSWTLTDWTQAGGGSRPLPSVSGDRALTIAFSREGSQYRATGFSGCNRYNATYVYANGLLLVQAPTGTRMACRSPEHTRLEQDFLAALVNIASSTLEPYSAPLHMKLVTQRGDVLTFSRAGDPLAGGVGIRKLIYVDSEQVTCDAGAARLQCLRVRDDPSRPWQLWYNGIEGFQPEPGVSYRLRVLEVPVVNPPADGGSLRWVLDAVIEQTVAR